MFGRLVELLEEAVRKETAGGLRIESIKGREDLDDEKVILRASEDIPKASQFLLYDNTFSADGTVSNENRHLFHLTLESDVVKDEEIYVWTQEGENWIESNVGLNRHHYYWGLKTKVWNADKDEVVHLAYVPHIATKEFSAD